MDAIELNMSKILDDIKWGQTPPKMGANAPFSGLAGHGDLHAEPARLGETGSSARRVLTGRLVHSP